MGPSVIDGDTIEIHGEKIRIWGIDAIESGQTCRIGGVVLRCAQEAAFGIAAHLEGQIISCEERGRDSYKRTVATCTVRGADLGAWLVRKGLALDYPKYSGGKYAGEESKAKAEKRGVWRTEFEPPWEWRRTRGR